ncbi:hypothetical protein NHQ30_003514 [Ciborinia camelliae]|nr:hypothetical protein NHQ30_003514 [Ciborinia camelliae]
MDNCINRFLLGPIENMENNSITQLAGEILLECCSMERNCRLYGTPQPNLAAGASKEFWSEGLPELTESRKKTLGILSRLATLLQGPHDFLHEFVAPSWDHGALYAFLESKQLEFIASSGGQASLFSLSERSGVPKDKLVRILELLRCRDIVHEPRNGIFSLTAISEELLHDGDFRAWVEFQLFETRIASAHLSETLLTGPNDYAEGISGFKQGFGAEMYDWHADHTENRIRFVKAMKGVSKALDPADSLIRGWFDHKTSASKNTKVIEIGGRYGFGSVSLAAEKSDLSFEIRCDSQDFLDRGEALIDPHTRGRIAFTHVRSIFEPCPASDSSSVFVYLMRNLFWNWTDDNVIKLLRSLLPILKAAPTYILITDGVSPLPKDFPPHVEIAYRRRDITTMAMHNVKQRTQDEWLDVFSQVDPALKVNKCFFVFTFSTTPNVNAGKYDFQK